jgi:hypothetical protein
MAAIWPQAVLWQREASTRWPVTSMRTKRPDALN